MRKDAGGDGLLVGSIFGIACADAASGETVEATVVGVFDLKKTASQAWAAGDKLYWDNTAREATKTATSIWERINLANLHENILPTRQRADLILTKEVSHRVEQVALRKL